MAKPERLQGGFELANGRAADGVSEKEAEAGRSRRGSWTASAAASPWHDPGLRLQRLHKETVLGAAVPLLVRGRAAGRGAERSGFKPRATGPGLTRPGTVPRLGALLPASEPGRPAPRWARACPPPANGRAGRLRPLRAIGRALSLLCCPPAGLRPSMGRTPSPLARWWVTVRPILPGGHPCSLRAGSQQLRALGVDRPLGTLSASPEDAAGPGTVRLPRSPRPGLCSSPSTYWFSPVAILPGTPLHLGDSCPVTAANIPPGPCAGSRPWGAHLGPSGSHLLRTPASPQV